MTKCALLCFKEVQNEMQGDFLQSRTLVGEEVVRFVSDIVLHL